MVLKDSIRHGEDAQHQSSHSGSLHESQCQWNCSVLGWTACPCWAEDRSVFTSTMLREHREHKEDTGGPGPSTV